MEQDTQTTLREIKSQLRAAMNGNTADYMRRSGIKYKLNYGVEIPRLRQIATQYTPTNNLAQTLWNQPVRECKLLATMLQPTQTFTQAQAHLWLSQIDNEEIAQHTTMNLLARLPYAPQLANNCIQSPNTLTQLCGLLIIARLLHNGYQPTPTQTHTFHHAAQQAIQSNNLSLRQAAAAILRHQTQTNNNQTFTTPKAE